MAHTKKSPVGDLEGNLAALFGLPADVDFLARGVAEGFDGLGVEIRG